MPPLHLRNWTAFAFMAVIAMFVGLLDRFLIGFNRGGPDVLFTIFKLHSGSSPWECCLSC